MEELKITRHPLNVRNYHHAPLEQLSEEEKLQVVANLFNSICATTPSRRNSASEVAASLGMNYIQLCNLLPDGFEAGDYVKQGKRLVHVNKRDGIKITPLWVELSQEEIDSLREEFHQKLILPCPKRHRFLGWNDLAMQAGIPLAQFKEIMGNVAIDQRKFNMTAMKCSGVRFVGTAEQQEERINNVKDLLIAEIKDLKDSLHSLDVGTTPWAAVQRVIKEKEDKLEIYEGTTMTLKAVEVGLLTQAKHNAVQETVEEPTGKRMYDQDADVFDI